MQIRPIEIQVDSFTGMISYFHETVTISPVEYTSYIILLYIQSQMVIYCLSGSTSSDYTVPDITLPKVSFQNTLS